MTAEPTVGRRQVVSATFASVIAWAFDLFDLFILLFVASTIGPLFFPSDVETLSLAAVYLSFAITLLMRPAGSAIFGAYADTHGRKRAMLIAVTGVGLATALMGAIPTYGQVGLLGPILFIALRIVQGIFVGGVVASTHTLGTETVAPRWRGLMSGLVGGGGAAVGAVFASLVYFLVSSIFPVDEFSVWGWRFMFFSGLIGAILSLFIFRAVEESPLWANKEAHHETQEHPLRTLFSPRYRAIFLANLVVVAGGATQYYLTLGFLPTFFRLINELPNNVAAQLLIVANLFAFAGAVAIGHLSEMVGRKRTFLLMGAVNLVAIPLLYYVLAGLGAESLVLVALCASGLAFLANGSYAPVLIFLNERFPTAIRASGTGLSWNTGFAIGGIMPTFVTALSPSVAAIPGRLIAFLIAWILLFLAGTLLFPETRGKFE